MIFLAGQLDGEVSYNEARARAREPTTLDSVP